MENISKAGTLLSLAEYPQLYSAPKQYFSLLVNLSDMEGYHQGQWWPADALQAESRIPQKCEKGGVLSASGWGKK